MHFQLLAYACYRRACADVGDAGERFVTQPHYFNRINPFHRGNLTA